MNTIVVLITLFYVNSGFAPDSQIFRGPDAMKECMAVKATIVEECKSLQSGWRRSCAEPRKLVCKVAQQ